MRSATAVACCLSLLLLASLAAGEGPRRPQIKGVAHVALFAHDIGKSRAYYTGLLGYPEALELKNPDGTLRLIFFRINDRQYLELFPEREAGGDRLNHVALETDDAEAMRQYLESRGVTVPGKVSKGRVGNTNFTVKDPDGHTLEFVQYQPDSALGQKKNPPSPEAISSSLRHAGILVGALDPALRFYGEVLGLRETWRGSRDGSSLDWVNLKLPDSEDYLEFMLYRELPEPGRRGSQHHICLEVPDVQKALATLQVRAARAVYERPMEVRTGINRKRQLNLFDPDGTRSELMEPQTIDGQPAPSSSAPPLR